MCQIFQPFITCRHTTMENVTQFNSVQFLENGTFATITSGSSISIDVNIRIIQSTIASEGIVANLNVIVVLLNH